MQSLEGTKDLFGGLTLLYLSHQELGSNSTPLDCGLPLVTCLEQIE